MSKLHNCKACTKEISKNAKICPYCGEPQKKSSSVKKIIGFVLVIVLILGGYILMNPKLVECGKALSSVHKVEDKINNYLSINDYSSVAGYIDYTISKYQKLKEVCTGTILEEEVLRGSDAINSLYNNPEFQKNWKNKIL